MILQIRRFIRGMINGNYLPCYVFSRKPMIVFAYDTDFVSNSENFLKRFAGCGDVFLFLQLGWQHETPKQADPFAAKLHEAAKQMPSLHITVLANSPVEVEVLSNLGLNAVFCHQNAFIDPSNYPVVKDAAKLYDAIYIARISPFKRHLLAKNIKSLRLVGNYYQFEKNYVDSVFSELKHASWRESVSSSKVYREIASARCGLCLSKEEGAMFVSAEYLLCGIPVVNTENIGGRDYLFPGFAAKTVPDNPDTVAAAVEEFCRNPIDPGKIRSATVEKMEESKTILKGLLADILNSCGAKCRKENISLPHKLGLRCTRMPWVNWKHGLKK